MKTKTAFIGVKVSRSEKLLAKKLAKQSKLGVSEWIRRKIFPSSGVVLKDSWWKYGR